MTADQVGTLVTVAVTGGLALWRAVHADKTASRVEAKTDATAGGIKDQLKGGAKTFEALRVQNTEQGERITTLEVRSAQQAEQVIALLDMATRHAERIAKLEARVDLERQRIQANAARIEALELRLTEPSKP